MKFISFIITSLITFIPGLAQNLEKLESFACNWDQLTVEKTNSGERRQIFEGYTNTLAYFEAHVTTLKPRNSPHESHVHADMEELIIVKAGHVSILHFNGSNGLSHDSDCHPTGRAE